MPNIRNVNLSNTITAMTKANAMKPIIALEATVVAGRTYQAYKRGKWDEARERFIEETMGSIVWLAGVETLNRIGDKILSKVLKTGGKSFDVGTDKLLRTPFDNFMQKIAPKNFSKEQVALMKAGKVLTSILIANAVIGFVVPKVNQSLTKKLRHERRIEQENNQKQNKQNPSFKGIGFNAINAFTNYIENNNTGKLLSTDAGVAGGRMYNARRKEERREVAIRDIGSIYFYMWAQGHVRNILNFVETGKFTRLNPATANILNEHLVKSLNDKSMSVEEFKKFVLGDVVDLPNGLNFEVEKLSSIEKMFNKKPLEVIKLSDVKNVIKDSDIIARATEMAKIQPERMGEAVLTKQQLLDAISVAKINDPEFLNKVFEEFTDGANKDEYKFVTNSKLYNLKSEMIDYVNNVCKQAKNGKIDKALLEKVKKKNLTYNGVNFVAGFAVAATFLSTLIPKLQYYVTRKTTGVDAFPGTYDYEKHHEEID